MPKKKTPKKKAKADPLLAEIETLAGLQFTRDQVATVVGLDAEKWADAHVKAFERGQLKAEAEIRKAIHKLALSGSSPAQKDYLGLIERRKAEEKRQARKGRR